MISRYAFLTFKIANLHHAMSIANVMAIIQLMHEHLIPQNCFKSLASTHLLHANITVIYRDYTCFGDTTFV